MRSQVEQGELSAARHTSSQRGDQRLPRLELGWHPRPFVKECARGPDHASARSRTDVGPLG